MLVRFEFEFGCYGKGFGWVREMDFGVLDLGLGILYEDDVI